MSRPHTNPDTELGGHLAFVFASALLLMLLSVLRLALLLFNRELLGDTDWPRPLPMACASTCVWWSSSARR